MKKHVSASKRAFDELMSKSDASAHRIGKDQTRQNGSNQAAGSAVRASKIETLEQAKAEAIIAQSLHTDKKPHIDKKSAGISPKTNFSAVNRGEYDAAQHRMMNPVVMRTARVSGMTKAAGNVARAAVSANVRNSAAEAPARPMKTAQAAQRHDSSSIKTVKAPASGPVSSIAEAKRHSSRRRGSIVRRAAVSVISAVMVIGAAVTVYAISAENGTDAIPDAVIGYGEASVPTQPDKESIVNTEAAALYAAADNSFILGEEKALQSDEASAPAESSETSADTRFTVTFTFYQEESVVCSTPETTVSALMEKLGIEAGEGKRMYVSGDDVISADAEIRIDTVEYKTEYDTEPVAYSTEYKDVRNIPRGTTKVCRNGVNGTKTVEYLCEYVNGEASNRQRQSESVTTAPTSQILYRGVGGTVGGYSYSYYIDVKATTYTGGGTTASGLPANESVIAVDPRVIPLGTKVYVAGSYGDFGVRTAADTGGSIKGNTIDVYLDSSNPYFGNFGWRSMRVYILG